MGWFERSWRWVALASSLGIAGVFAVVPSASGFGDASRGLVRAPSGPYAVGGDAVVFSPHGRWLATAGEGLSVLRVNQKTGQLRRVAHVHFAVPAEPDAVAFSPDGRFLATAGFAPLSERSEAIKAQLFIFRVNRYNGTLRKVAAMSPGDYEMSDVAFDPTGRFLAIPGGDCGGVKILAFNRRTGALRKLPRSSYSGDRCVDYVRFNPAGNLLAASGGSGDRILLYRVNTRTRRLTRTAAWSDGSQSFSGRVAFSPDGSMLAAPITNENCGLALLSVGDGHKLKKVSGSPFLVRSCPDRVVFSPDGRLIATLFFLERVALLSFDQQTGAIQTPLGSPVRTGSQYPQALAFSPNGKLLVVGNGVDVGHETVRVFFVPSACADSDCDNDCDS